MNFNDFANTLRVYSSASKPECNPGNYNCGKACINESRRCLIELGEEIDVITNKFASLIGKVSGSSEEDSKALAKRILNPEENLDDIFNNLSSELLKDSVFMATLADAMIQRETEIRIGAGQLDTVTNEVLQTLSEKAGVDKETFTHTVASLSLLSFTDAEIKLRKAAEVGNVATIAQSIFSNNGQNNGEKGQLTKNVNKNIEESIMAALASMSDSERAFFSDILTGKQNRKLSDDERAEFERFLNQKLSAVDLEARDGKILLALAAISQLNVQDGETLFNTGFLGKIDVSDNKKKIYTGVGSGEKRKLFGRDADKAVNQPFGSNVKDVLKYVLNQELYEKVGESKQAAPPAYLEGGKPAIVGENLLRDAIGGLINKEVAPAGFLKNAQTAEDITNFLKALKEEKQEELKNASLSDDDKKTIDDEIIKIDAALKAAEKSKATFSNLKKSVQNRLNDILEARDQRISKKLEGSSRAKVTEKYGGDSKAANPLNELLTQMNLQESSYDIVVMDGREGALEALNSLAESPVLNKDGQDGIRNIVKDLQNLTDKIKAGENGAAENFEKYMQETFVEALTNILGDENKSMEFAPMFYHAIKNNSAVALLDKYDGYDYPFADIAIMPKPAEGQEQKIYMLSIKKGGGFEADVSAAMGISNKPLREKIRSIDDNYDAVLSTNRIVDVTTDTKGQTTNLTIANGEPISNFTKPASTEEAIASNKVAIENALRDSGGLLDLDGLRTAVNEGKAGPNTRLALYRIEAIIEELAKKGEVNLSDFNFSGVNFENNYTVNATGASGKDLRPNLHHIFIGILAEGTFQDTFTANMRPGEMHPDASMELDIEAMEQNQPKMKFRYRNASGPGTKKAGMSGLRYFLSLRKQDTKQKSLQEEIEKFINKPYALLSDEEKKKVMEFFAMVNS